MLLLVLGCVLHSTGRQQQQQPPLGAAAHSQQPVPVCALRLCVGAAAVSIERCRCNGPVCLELPTVISSCLHLLPPYTCSSSTSPVPTTHSNARCWFSTPLMSRSGVRTTTSTASTPQCTTQKSFEPSLHARRQHLGRATNTPPPTKMDQSSKCLCPPRPMCWV